MVEEIPNIIHEFPGGVVEEAKATKFRTDEPDPETGLGKVVELPDRICVTYGRRKVTISGMMARAIYQTYHDDQGFRDWCERCK